MSERHRTTDWISVMGEALEHTTAPQPPKQAAKPDETATAELQSYFSSLLCTELPREKTEIEKEAERLLEDLRLGVEIKPEELQWLKNYVSENEAPDDWQVLLEENGLAGNLSAIGGTVAFVPGKRMSKKEMRAIWQTVLAE